MLVDENAHYIANSKRSESFNRACDIRNLHAQVLSSVKARGFSKAEDAWLN
ncbi:MAG: hypothetical protein IPM60_11375 [Rhodospirillales bacterium]|nr:hypothetical protein [Rhodospirillales bacterium]